MPRPRALVFAFLVLPCLGLPLLALADGPPRRFAEGTHGRGELRSVGGLPVLTVAGTPEEIGTQKGVLLKQSAGQLLPLFKEFLKAKGLEAAWPLLARAGKSMEPRIPPEHLRELDALAQAAGLDRELLLVAHVLPDMVRIGGCSVLIVGPERSATKGPLFGRNLDIPPVIKVHEHTLVTIYRPKGKHAFVSVNFPGMIGCATGMNEAGLVIATNEIYAAKDGSPEFDPQGTPLGFGCRRLLEECTTVAEAEKLIRALKWTTRAALSVCDRQGGAVFEITPRTVAVRRSTDGCCAATNHFRSAELATDLRCDRFELLAKTSAARKSFTVADVAGQLHAVHQGDWTVQTMVFEPAALRLHLAIGGLPASAQPLKTLDVRPFFAKE